MTLPQSLDLIGWSVREFARRIGKPEDTVRAWVRRDNAPAWAVQYAEHVAQAVQRVERPAA